MRIECPGVVVTDSNGAALCQDTVGAPLSWTTIPSFDIESIDNAVAAEAFAAGFVIVATAWAIGRGVSIVLGVIGR
jgi:hypothetical protein